MTRRLPALLLVLALAGCGGDAGSGPGDGPGPGPDPTDYFPPWRDAVPTATITLDHDPLLSDGDNGDALAAAIAALAPGERLEVGGGTWSVHGFFDISLEGSASAPIVIAAKAGETPVITRPDNAQNVVNVGATGPARYLALQGLEITGGAGLLRLVDAWNIWVSGCHLHDGGGDAIAATGANTDRLYITGNVIERAHPGNTARAIVLGAPNATTITGNSIVAQNTISEMGGGLSEGIAIRAGSYNVLVARNDVSGVASRAISVLSTGGLAPHRVERNLVHASPGTGIFVSGHVRVENNIVAGTGEWALRATGFGGGAALGIELVHNTLATTAGTEALRLDDWSGGSGLLLANSAIYCDGGDAIVAPDGTAGATIVGNMHFGGLPPGFGGTTAGNGFPDFVDLAPDGSDLDATPSAGSPLLGAGAAAWAAAYEFDGSARTGDPDAGAVQR